MFYHLTRSGAEATVLTLLPRAIAAGWRVMIRGGDSAALDRLDARLWLDPEDGFMPHGMEGGPHDADQPVLLGQGAAVNGAQALALLDGADVTIDEAQRMQRVWTIFDGDDKDAVKTFVPRIRDGVLAQLRTLSYEQATDPAHAEKLRTELLERCKHAGAENAERILVTDLVVQ